MRRTHIILGPGQGALDWVSEASEGGALQHVVEHRRFRRLWRGRATRCLAVCGRGRAGLAGKVGSRRGRRPSRLVLLFQSPE